MSRLLTFAPSPTRTFCLTHPRSHCRAQNSVRDRQRQHNHCEIGMKLKLVFYRNTPFIKRGTNYVGEGKTVVSLPRSLSITRKGFVSTSECQDSVTVLCTSSSRLCLNRLLADSSLCGRLQALNVPIKHRNRFTQLLPCIFPQVPTTAASADPLPLQRAEPFYRSSNATRWAWGKSERREAEGSLPTSPHPLAQGRGHARS